MRMRFIFFLTVRRQLTAGQRGKSGRKWRVVAFGRKGWRSAAAGVRASTWGLDTGRRRRAAGRYARNGGGWRRLAGLKRRPTENREVDTYQAVFSSQPAADTPDASTDAARRTTTTARGQAPRAQRVRPPLRPPSLTPESHNAPRGLSCPAALLSAAAELLKKNKSHAHFCVRTQKTAIFAFRFLTVKLQSV